VRLVLTGTDAGPGAYGDAPSVGDSGEENHNADNTDRVSRLCVDRRALGIDI
jgi:hypothetical protein